MTLFPFILGVEILSNKIRQHPDLPGITMPASDHRHNRLYIFQYADDTTIFVNNIEEANVALSIVDKFSKFSGVSLNRNNTEALWIGHEPPIINHNAGNIKWQYNCNSTIQILGIYFSPAMEASRLDSNWRPKINRLLSNIQAWQRRDLSIMGKIQILTLCNACHYQRKC